MIFLTDHLILDAICDKVASNNFGLFVGWSIGSRDAVASTLAVQFRQSILDIDFFVEELIQLGWLTNKTRIPPFYSNQEQEQLAVTPAGWLQWNHFDGTYLDEQGFSNSDEWIAAEPFLNHQYSGVEIFVSPSQSLPTQKKKQKSILDDWHPSVDETTGNEGMD
jgi:hypothetical protein